VTGVDTLLNIFPPPQKRNLTELDRGPNVMITYNCPVYSYLTRSCAQQYSGSVSICISLFKRQWQVFIRGRCWYFKLILLDPGLRMHFSK